MLEKRRCSGVDVLGDVPWGTHFCQFYQTPQDLLEVLVGYFQQGLRNNEFCMWVTSEPLGVEEARSALRRAVPDLDDRIDRGQIEFLEYRQWYLLDGQFDADRVLQGWIEKERDALARGYEGLRASGNMSWLDEGNWKAFTNYEAVVNDAISSHRILALCAYPLDKCRGIEMLDVFRNHPIALVRNGSKWEVIEIPQLRKTMAMLTENGDLKWFETIKTPLLDDRGEVVGTTGLARDITERKEAEDALTESEGRYHSLFNSM
jgi:PAS domain-containing protein